MIVLLGESCSGKSTIERMLNLKRIVSYTTRPIRKSETNHVDYHFISELEFEESLLSKFFVEHTKYNGWNYAIAEEDCHDDCITVVEPNGFRQLKRNPNLNITSFYIKADERERMIRMMKRGDNLMESIRRIISDQGSFNGIAYEIDYTIDNPDGKLEEAVRNIRTILKL